MRGRADSAALRRGVAEADSRESAGDVAGLERGEGSDSIGRERAKALEFVLDIVFVAVGGIAGNELADKTGKE